MIGALPLRTPMVRLGPQPGKQALKRWENLVAVPPPLSPELRRLQADQPLWSQEVHLQALPSPKLQDPYYADLEREDLGLSPSLLLLLLLPSTAPQHQEGLLQASGFSLRSFLSLLWAGLT